MVQNPGNMLRVRIALPDLKQRMEEPAETGQNQELSIEIPGVAPSVSESRFGERPWCQALKPGLEKASGGMFGKRDDFSWRVGDYGRVDRFLLVMIHPLAFKLSMFYLRFHLCSHLQMEWLTYSQWILGSERLATDSQRPLGSWSRPSQPEEI